MDFFSSDGRRLETLADWRDHGGPVSSRQWAEGRSSRELARAWIERDAAAQVTSLLTTVPELGGLVLDHGVPEKATLFDDIPGGPRHHDLLVIGRSPRGAVVIGVEGKSDEPFDEPLEQDATSAVLLVHEFETPWTRDELHRRNAEDLDAFLGRLMPGVNLAGEERAWIAGPVAFAGDGRWLPDEAAVYLAKLMSRAPMI